MFQLLSVAPVHVSSVHPQIPSGVSGTPFAGVGRSDRLHCPASKGNSLHNVLSLGNKLCFFLGGGGGVCVSM